MNVEKGFPPVTLIVGGQTVSLVQNRDFMNFQQNLRTTALGVRFGKELLSDPDSLSPETITRVLRAMGLEIPPEVKLANDAAQALITGHTAIQMIDTATTVSDYRQIISMSANSTRTLGLVAHRLELIDRDTATTISLGSDVASLIASKGTDVGAWIRIGMTIGQETAITQAEADHMAKVAVVGSYSKDVEKQIQNFMDSLRQLESGEIGLFGFLVKNASKSQLIFDNVITNNPAFKPIADKIPGLHMLPVGTWTYSASAKAYTLWGEAKKANESITVPALALLPTAKAVDFLLDNMIFPGANHYMFARDQYLSRGKADIFNVALFSLFEPSFYLKRNMSLLDELTKFQISPWELGEKDVFRSEGFTQSVGIMSSFGFTKTEKVFTKAELDFMDRTGNIEALRGNRFAAEQMRLRFDFGELPQETGSFGFQYDWRNMANFISILDFLDLVYSDPSYEQLRKESDTLSRYDIFPRIQALKARFEIVWKRSVVRRVNLASKINAAYFLGVPVSKLDPVKRQDNATIFKAK